MDIDIETGTGAIDRPYPLLFQPILVDKVWGGDRLERLGKTLPPGVAIGESWELADLEVTSRGASAGSIIRNGALAGRPIRDAIHRWGDALLGGVELAEWGGFPALVKYLDATQHLSVQVHPDADYALLHEGANLKSECWYVIEAEAGATLYLGLAEGVKPSDLIARARTGTVVDLLQAYEAVPGTWYNVPSGTVHALGAGVLVAEIQTASDTTFRVYDWAEEYGRSGRTLHLEEAAQCIREDKPPQPVALDPVARDGVVVRTPFFTVSEFRMEGRETIEPTAADAGCRILMATSGSVEVRTVGNEPVTLSLGDTCLVPANCLSGLEVEAIDDTVLIVVRFNDSDDH